MAEPRGDQRSPNIGLRFSDQADLNFNWSKLDDVVGTAFTPDAPLQIPPESIVTSQLYPGTAVHGWISSGITSSFWALATPRQLAQLFLSPFRGGHIITAGSLCLALTNRKSPGAALIVELQITLTIAGAPRLIGKFNTLSLPPTSTIPLGVPLSGIYEVSPSDITNQIEVKLEGMKTTGVDADSVIVDTGGTFAVAELA